MCIKAFRIDFGKCEVSRGARIRSSDPQATPSRPRRTRTKSAEEIKSDQEIYTVLNDLSRFIKIGTIDVRCIPSLTAPGVEAPDGWRWITPPIDRRLKLSRELESIAYLYRKMLARMTYMVIGKAALRFRIYMLPLDAEGRRCLPRVSSVVRKTIREVLELVNASKEAWSGEINAPFVRLIEETPTSAPSLFDMFNSITPTTRQNSSPLNDYEIDEITKEIRTGKIKGMKSTLYPYQQETVAEMLNKELLPEQVPDPRFREMTAIDGTRFYIDSVTLEIYSQTSQYDGCYGGVLAEEMGFGKTCICIALICATLRQGSRVPEMYIHNPVTYHRTPRLSDLCVSIITRYGLSWRYYHDGLSPESIRLLSAHNGFYDMEDTRYISTRASSRTRQDIRYRRILLSRTTLIVCPDSLVHQWINELDKHVEKGFLSVMEFKNARRSGTQFEKFDVVVMSQRRFAKEYEDGIYLLFAVKPKKNYKLTERNRIL